MARGNDLTGLIFGKLTVIERAGSNKFGRAMWKCKCNCEKQTIVIVSGFNLTQKQTTSCSCVKKTSNGLTNEYPREYGIWRKMIDRCYSEKDDSYQYYGQRGIATSDSWRESFITFMEDMGPRPDKTMILGRKDINGDYCTDNCNWVYPESHAINKRNTVLVEYDGMKLSASQWGRLLGISHSSITQRLNVGLPIEEVLFKNSKTIPICERVPIK